MKRALERHDAKEACVIPIILRPVDWEHAPFARLQVRPTYAKPMSKWTETVQPVIDRFPVWPGQTDGQTSQPSLYWDGGFAA